MTNRDARSRAQQWLKEMAHDPSCSEGTRAGDQTMPCDCRGPESEPASLIADLLAENTALRADLAQVQREKEFWEEEARRFALGEEFYRELLYRCGECFGVEARTADDGSVMESVLGLKVPELVERQTAALTEARAHLHETDELHARQLAACDVAALSNTRESFARAEIDRDNPAWTVAYSSVMNAVRREIEFREKYGEARAALARKEQECEGAKRERDSAVMLKEQAQRYHEGVYDLFLRYCPDEVRNLPIDASQRTLGATLTKHLGERAERAEQALARVQAQLQEAFNLMKAATYQGHSAHWDPQGTNGANCPACNDAREMREAAQKKWELATALAGSAPQGQTDNNERTALMTPTTGRLVLYALSEADADAVNRRRTDSRAIRERMQASPKEWPEGAQAHIGNTAREGDTVPLLVVRVWPNEYGENVPGVNGQAFLDGNDVLWVTSAKEGTQPGQWSWPPRV